MSTFIWIQTEPNRKTRLGLGLGLDPINYTSGSYISRIKKPKLNREPSQNQT